jgi:hypothetical protein
VISVLMKLTAFAVVRTQLLTATEMFFADKAPVGNGAAGLLFDLGSI